MTENDESSLLNLDNKIESTTTAKNKQLKKTLSIVGGLVLAVLLVFVVVQFMPTNGHHTENSDKGLDTVNTYSTAELEQARDVFKQALAVFAQSSQSILDNIDIQQWDQQRVAQIRALKNSAIARFANSAYADAIAQLKEAEQQTTLLKQAWDDAFTQNMQQAQNHFLSDDINNAKLALSRALSIKPQDPNAQELSSRLGAFDQVSKAIKAFNVAQAENNLSKQINALKNILSLDPQRENYQRQLKQLIKRQTSDNIARALNLGQIALANGDISTAQQRYNELRALAPNNQGVKQLGREVASVTTLNQRQQVILELKALAKNDQWQDVISKSKFALTLFERDAEINELADKARNIIRIQTQLEGYLRSPKRLQDGNIEARAKSILSEAVAFITQSKTLSEQVRQLSDLVSKLTTTYSVDIISDNKTNISVLGVGIVGIVDSKRIELKPGTYVLQGQRDGYRSKQLELVVTEHQTDRQITLVCDERI